jgi:hypothetical protein
MLIEKINPLLSDNLKMNQSQLKALISHYQKQLDKIKVDIEDEHCEAIRNFAV